MVSSKTCSKAHFSKLIALISLGRHPLFYRVIAATLMLISGSTPCDGAQHSWLRVLRANYQVFELSNSINNT